MSAQLPLFHRNKYSAIKTEEAAWPWKAGNYVTLALASLAISLFITLIIGVPPYRPPFF